MIDTCGHCGYRIPTAAPICPGCGRRHAPHADRAAPPGRRRSSRLVRAARGTRWLLALLAWVAAAFGVAAVARYVVGLDGVADDLSATTIERVADTAHGLGLAAVVAFGLAVAGAITWSRQAHRNLATLRITSGWTKAWSLGGWLVPGARAKAAKRSVDELWRESSPVLADLPHRGWSRRPVSRVVLHWWTLWLAVPAIGLLVVAVMGGPEDLRDERALMGLAGAALAVAAARALYDVVGLVTVAQSHRAGAVLQDGADAEPWGDEDAGWADAPPAEDRSDLEPLRG